MENRKEKVVVIYHKNCPDGYGALSGVVYKYGIKDLTYVENEEILKSSDENFYAIPTNHSTQFTRLRSILEQHREEPFVIYMVDFFTPEIFDILRNYPNVKKLIIIDHHKTTEETLKEGIPEDVKDRVEYTLDMNMSGATLTWKVLNGFIPEVMKYIEDRDIWKWSIPDSIYVLTALDSEIFNVLNPNEVVFALLQLVKDFPKEKLAEKGKAMIEFKNSVIKRLIKYTTHYIILPSGHKLPAINSPIFQSEIGNELAKTFSEGVACVYSIAPQEDGVYVNCSIRSINGKAREIAQANGGGGHDNASGCRVKLEKVKFEKLN